MWYSKKATSEKKLIVKSEEVILLKYYRFR